MTISPIKPKAKWPPAGERNKKDEAKTPLPKKSVHLEKLTPMEYHSRMNGWNQKDFI